MDLGALGRVRPSRPRLARKPDGIEVMANFTTPPINYGARNPGGLTAANPGDTLYIPFATYNDSGASIGKSGFAKTDIEVFKNGGVTARATDSGYSILTDTGQYGDRLGLHRFSISLFNTSDDPTFYATGAQYHVAVDAITVDGRTLRFFPAVFEIGTPRANIVQIDGDTGAADQLGDAFADGFNDTGVNARFNALGTATGSALSIDATTDNTAGGISGVTSGTTFVGSQTGTVANTSAQDLVYHTITHSGNAIDIVYQFNIGAGAAPVLCVWIGYLTGNNDQITISAWDHAGGAWDSMATIPGQAGSANLTHNCPLFTRYVGTSVGELGKVYIRLHCTGQTSPVLNTDQIYMSYAITSADISAIKVKTDSLTFTVAGSADANVQQVNDVTVAGAGASGNRWRPA
jgi:hypothetical protein